MASPKAKLCIVEFTLLGSILTTVDWGNVILMARRFCRPFSAAPSRYLFVGNCGPSVGLDVPSIQSLFANYGPVEVDITEPAKSYVFLTFPAASLATEAMKHFKEIDTSRCFVMHYADVKAPSGPVDTHPVLI